MEVKQYIQYVRPLQHCHMTTIVSQITDNCTDCSTVCPGVYHMKHQHYDDVIMTTMASQITSLTVVYSTVYSDADQRKHQSSVSLAFVWGLHRDRWIPRTKGQLRGKCFHLMTSLSKLHATGPLWGESTSDWWFPSQRASNMGSFFMWWHHHATKDNNKVGYHSPRAAMLWGHLSNMNGNIQKVSSISIILKSRKITEWTELV